MNIEQTQTAETAKKFLRSRVVEQAARDGVNLTPVEQRMLLWNEPTATAEDWEASQKFEEQFDNADWEAKIAGLLRKAYTQDKRLGFAQMWKQSLEALRSDDCYLLVMVDQAGIPHASWILPPEAKAAATKQWLGLLKIGVLLVLVSAGPVFLLFTEAGRRLSHHSDVISGVVFIAWAAAVWLLIRRPSF